MCGTFTANQLFLVRCYPYPYPSSITGTINLSSCLSVVSLNEPIKNYKFVFDVCTSERVYHLAADSEEERMEWVTTLKDLLFGQQQTVS